MSSLSLYELSVPSVVNIQPSDSTPLDIAHAVHAAMDLNCDTKNKRDESWLVNGQLAPCPNCSSGALENDRTFSMTSYGLSTILDSPICERVPSFCWTSSVSVPALSSPRESTITRSSSDSVLPSPTLPPERPLPPPKLNYQEHVFFLNTDCQLIRAALKKQPYYLGWFALVSPNNTTNPPFIVISWMLEPNYASIEYNRRKHVRIRYHNSKTQGDALEFSDVKDLLAYYKSNEIPSGGFLSHQLRRQHVCEEAMVHR